MEDKQYYSISEVSEGLDVPQPTLRYWEKVFGAEIPSMLPHRSAGSTRRYNKKDVENMRFIQFLLKEKGLSIKSAIEHIKAQKGKHNSGDKIAQFLAGIRAELNAEIKVCDAIIESGRQAKER